MTRRYLLLDDNAAFAENLAEILRDEGAEVTVVGTGAAALEAVRTTRFDALLTDMRMPTMGGAEVVHAVRQVDPGIPALVMTAYIRDAELARAREAGLLSVFPKPVPLRELLRLMRVARRDALVVLVEDDAVRFESLIAELRERGFSTVTTQSAEQTRQLACAVPCAGIVDLRVGGGTEATLLRAFADRFPHVPALVVAAVPASPELPAQEIFTEPVGTRVLLEAVERVYRASGAQGLAPAGPAPKPAVGAR